MAPSAELSLRYLPDLSTSEEDASTRHDVSNSSFQIPLGNNTDLLADTSIKFLRDDTVATPAPPSTRRPIAKAAIPDDHTNINTRPLRIAELTPRRDKPKQAVRSSLRLRQKMQVAIPTPLRSAVKNDLSAALEDDLSPLRPRARSRARTKSQEDSFQIPATSKLGNLLVDETDFLNGKDLSSDGSSKQESLTMSQLTPKPPKVPVKEDDGEKAPRSDTVDDMLRFLRAESGNLEDIHDELHTDPPQTDDKPLRSGGTVSDHSVHESEPLVSPASGKNEQPQPQPASNFEAGRIDDANSHNAVLGPPNSCKTKASVMPANQRKNGDKAKRRKSVIRGGITKGGKPKATQTALAQVLSRNAGKASVPQDAKRGEPMVSQASGARTTESSTSVARRREPKSAGAAAASTSSRSGSGAYPTAGGLAAMLMSYGARIIAADHRAGETVLGDDQGTAAAIRGPVEDVDLAVDVGKDVQVPLPGTSSGSHSPLAVSLSQPSPTAAANPPAQADEPPNSGWGTSAARPSSPLRLSIKRPTSDACEAVSPRRKRSRLAPASGPSELPSSNKALPRTRALRASRVKNAPPATAPFLASSASTSSAAALPVGTAAAPFALHRRAHSAPKVEAKARSYAKATASTSSRALAAASADEAHTSNGQLTAASSRSASLRSSQSGNVHNSQGENIPEAAPARRAQEGHTRRPGHLPAFDKPAASLPPAKPTRPIEFHFQSDARLEARLGKSASTNGHERAGSAGSASSTRRAHAHHHPIPDFKARHALQESQTLARKEHRQPTIPVPMEFATDARMKEREKFDEARRERERILEEQMEARQQEKELEVEREVRELRRRAVPKANEVPEWYASAPRRARKAT